MFGSYLSSTLINEIVKSGKEPQLGGIDAEITAFFSDVQAFSSFSEKLPPDKLVALMNEYLSHMTDVLIEDGCYIDKFIGDAIVGIYNAPVNVKNHALKACITTQKLHKRLAELREKWRSEGDQWPPEVANMQMRIGLNTGNATVGNMGSKRYFNYTMMGDMVNLAARCESGSKLFGVYTMITEATKIMAEQSGSDCVFRYLDRVIVKGKSKPVKIFEIYCLKSDLNSEMRACLKHYEVGIRLYFRRDWPNALQAFEQSLKLEPNRKELNPLSTITPSDVFIKRTQELIKKPPPKNWDGVYIMTSK